ncbi:MAG: translocation/assembly module TamB domain-containing protein [Alphaproteobacteria bacterium]|nr:translocation/assembly module TamB domain-containing protein [Alphaproteobacteria bacterium]
MSRHGRLTQAVAASGVPERTLAADLSGRLTPLAPPVAEAFLMGETRVTAQARLSDAFVPLEVTLSAASDTLSSDIAATFDAETSALDATVDLRLRRRRCPHRAGTARPAGHPRRHHAVGGRPRRALRPGLAHRPCLGLRGTDEATLETLQVVLSGSDLDASDPTEEIPPPSPRPLPDCLRRRTPPPVLPAPCACPAWSPSRRRPLPPTSHPSRPRFAPFALTANGTVGLAEVDADLKLNISDLARLSPRSRVLTVDAHVEGPLTAPVITADASAVELLLSGKPVRDLQLSARADTNPEALSADLELTATVDGNDLAAALRAEPEGDGLRVPTLSLTAGENTLSGDFAIADLARATQTLTGSLTIAAPDLSEFSALALTELAGRLSGQIDLTQEAGRATAHVQLTGTEISAAGTQVAGLDADLTLRDLFTAPALAGKAHATGILTGGTPVEQVDITASGTGDNTEFSLDARLAKGADADGVALTGTLATGNDGLDLLLKTLDGRYRGIRTQLSDPPVSSPPRRHAHRAVFVAPRRRAPHPCRDGGRHARREGRHHLRAAGAGQCACAGFAIAGTLNGAVTVAGATSNPVANWTLNASGLSAAPLRDNGLAALSLASTGRYSGNGLTQTTRVTGSDGLSLVAEGPVTLSGAGSLNIGVTGSIPLAVVRQRLILSGFSATGSLAVSGRIGGTLSAPTYALALQPGGVNATQLATGFSLRNLTGSIDVANTGIAINALRADIAGGGSLSAGGRISLDNGMPADLRVQVQNGRYTDGQIVQATVTADITLTGPIASTTSGARLGGSVTIERADISIPSSLPGAIDPVAVTHKNAPAAVAAQDRALQRDAGGGSECGGGARPIALDITVNAPGRIFVRGRGLDAEMGGSLRLVGTTADPQAIGSFSMRRGLLNVLSRRVVFSKGDVGFTGSLTPRLDFAATSQTSDAAVTITVRVGQRAGDRLQLRAGVAAGRGAGPLPVRQEHERVEPDADRAAWRLGADAYRRQWRGTARQPAQVARPRRNRRGNRRRRRTVARGGQIPERQYLSGRETGQRCRFQPRDGGHRHHQVLEIARRGRRRRGIESRHLL